MDTDHHGPGRPPTAAHEDVHDQHLLRSSTPRTCWAPSNSATACTGQPTLEVDGATGHGSGRSAAPTGSPTIIDARRASADTGLTATRRVADRASTGHLRSRPDHRGRPRRRHPAVHAALQPGHQGHRLLGGPRLGAQQHTQDPGGRNPGTHRPARCRDQPHHLPTRRPAPSRTRPAARAPQHPLRQLRAPPRPASTASPGSTQKTSPSSATTSASPPPRRAGATRKAHPGAPYRGPVPDELAEQWDTAAWATPAPYKKRRHLDGGMRHDPGWAVVSALEIFDEDTGQAPKAPIFSTDLLTAAQRRLTADSPEDALAMSLDRNLRVDIDYIAGLLEVPASDAPRPHRRPGLSEPGRPRRAGPGHHCAVGQRAPEIRQAALGRRAQPRLRALRRRAARGRSARPHRRPDQGPARRTVDRPAIRRPVRPGDIRGHRRHRRAPRWPLDGRRCQVQAPRPTYDRNLGPGSRQLRRGQSA